MSKKKQKTNKTKSSQISNKKLAKVFLLIFSFAILSVGVSYFIMQKENSIKTTKTSTIIKKEEPLKIEKSDELKEFDEKKLDEHFENKRQEETYHSKYEEITEEVKKDIIEHHPKIIDKKIEKKQETTKISEEKKVEEKVESTKKIEIQEKYDESKIVTQRDKFKFDHNDKPKLAIVIDDVTTSAQKRRILDVGYKVTMAFLPPTPGHKNSASIAQDLPFYMIHFPLQASSKFSGPEINTLTINDSYETIEKRVAQLRKWYPKAIYTNNHTGSVFTENHEAMDKLFKALKKHNFIFVDSRTSANSVVKKYAKKYNMPYIVRNTFLDNEKDFHYIQNQLKKAIIIAKKRGFAIAIGHPYNITTEVLAKSKHLLKDVEPIYINELPYLK
jgi:polysaccharide deacetylase 2 family uncharacterized protein YibQ